MRVYLLCSLRIFLRYTLYECFYVSKFALHYVYIFSMHVLHICLRIHYTYMYTVYILYIFIYMYLCLRLYYVRIIVNLEHFLIVFARVYLCTHAQAENEGSAGSCIYK